MEYLTIVSSMVRQSARAVAQAAPAPTSNALFPWLPKWAKVLFLLVVLANSSSLPFLWHLRVWLYPLQAYLSFFRRGRIGHWLTWRQRLEDRGGIFKSRTVVRRRVLADDCDYNMHLSNSCYAKNSDPCRMKWCIENMVPVFRTGVHMALGAAHYQFLREIPIGTKYTMETRLGGFGDKWINLVTEFVIYSKGKPKRSSTCEGPHIIPPMSAPPSGTDTPASGIELANGNGNGHVVTADEVVKRVAARARAPRADGGVVACVSVANYCIKHGRITVPPRIALHLSLLSPSAELRQHALDVLASKDHGVAWVRGGWRDDPLADKLGRDIARDDTGSLAWAEAGAAAMEQVADGLASF